MTKTLSLRRQRGWRARRGRRRAPPATPKLVKKWESEAAFKVPESVCFDKAGKVLYVSNIDGEPWAKDGAGSIGKLGLDGKVIAAEWVKGLNAPKGMALSKGTLWVADLSEVVGIDVAKGAIATRDPRRRRRPKLNNLRRRRQGRALRLRFRDEEGPARSRAGR